MNKDKYFADIYVHLHSDSRLEEKGKVEQALCSSQGVFSVHFDRDKSRNAMVVAYNPEAISAEALLNIIQKKYARAVKVATMWMRVRA